MSKLLFKQALERYANNVGLSEMHYDDEFGTCFEFDEGIELSLIWNEQIECVFATIYCGNPTTENTANLYRQMLQANYFWSETAGATLSYEKELNSVFLIDKWRHKQIESPTTLSQHIDKIVEAASYWKKQISLGGEQASIQSHAIERSYRHIPGLETL